jgi:serine/threonine protein kinase
MTPERWKQISQLYEAAHSRPASERSAFLMEACASDEELRRDVRSLLDQATSLKALEGLIPAFAEQVMGDDVGANMVGRRFGACLVHERIAVGGMGEVYRARDTRLGRDVAIKVLPPAFANDADRLARFEREARVLAALDHPHIGAIHGIEESDATSSSGAPIKALVLAFIEGETLADRIARAPLSIREALEYARQIASALEAAHDKSIVHRDLKPGNIKITPAGNVKVLDFGLAKADGVTSVDAPGKTARGTRTGIVMGTPAYMSPEQMRGQAVDKRTDIWAFGCVLFEMLTGRAAFAAETVSDTVAAILDKDVNWSLMPEATPIAVRRLLPRCLAKESSRRLRDIGDAKLDLEDVNDTQPVVLNVVPARTRLPMLWVVAAGAALAGALVVWFWRNVDSIGPAPSVVRFSEPIDLADILQFPDIALSPDGKMLVYAAEQGLYVRSMSDREARSIPGTEGPRDNVGTSNPAFSPDARSIAFFSGSASYGGAIKMIDAGGGVAESLLRMDFPPCGMSWSNDGIIFGRCFGKGQKGVLRVRPGSPEELLIPTADEVVHGPQMLPDGRTILFTLASSLADDRWDKARVVVQSLVSGERKTLIQGGSDARYLQNGRIVYAIGEALWAVPFDLRRLEVTGQPVRVVEGVRRANPVMSGAASFAISNMGTLGYISSPPPALYDLAQIDRAGNIKRFEFPSGAYQNLRVSPDGKHVALGTKVGDEYVISVGDLTGSPALRRLTFHGRNRFPIWSADGARVTFQSDRDGDAGIFWQLTDGTGSTERLTTAPEATSHEPEAWSPSGEHLLFRVARGPRYSLWAYSLKARQATPFGDIESPIPPNAAFSKDGRWVAYSSRDADKFLIFVQPFPATGAKYQVNEGGIFPAWSPDGRELFYFHGASEFGVVKILQNPVPAVGTSTNLWPAGLVPASRVEPTEDGKFMTLIRAKQSSARNVEQLHVVLDWFEELEQRLVPRN